MQLCFETLPVSSGTLYHQGLGPKLCKMMESTGEERIDPTLHGTKPDQAHLEVESNFGAKDFGERRASELTESVLRYSRRDQYLARVSLLRKRHSEKIDLSATIQHIYVLMMAR